MADTQATRRGVYRSGTRRSVSESRIVTTDEMREMNAAIQEESMHQPEIYSADASAWYAQLSPAEQSQYDAAWQSYYPYYNYDVQTATLAATAEWSGYYPSMPMPGTAGYDPYSAAAAAAAATTAIYYGTTSPEALAAVQAASDAAQISVLHNADLMPPSPAAPLSVQPPVTDTNTLAVPAPQPAAVASNRNSVTQTNNAPSGTTQHIGWNTAVLDRSQHQPGQANRRMDIPGTFRTNSVVTRGTVSGTMSMPMAAAVNTSIRRRRTVKRIELTRGNLVVDCPVPSKMLDRCVYRSGEEFTRLRYSAVTCDPDDFARNQYTLRPVLYNRKTELFIVVTMYNEDDILFCRTINGVMRNIQHLCSRSRSSTWGEAGWQKVVVCIVSDGRQNVHPRVLSVLAAMGVYQDGIAKNQVNGREVNAHLFEYTTQLSISSNMKVQGPDKGVIPCQMLFCLKEKNSKKINSHRWFFNAFAPVLNPNVCVLLDVGTRPDDASIYHLWKAFDLDPLVGGACGEVGVMKGLAWWHLLNPLVASQHFEYKLSNILDKPLESTLGYIMVLPGAFSAYRYAAVRDDLGGRGPLASYFKGEPGYQPTGGQPSKKTVGQKQTAGVFEANMYLAEDRVLCFEVVAKRNERWLLRYVRSAYGETDVPQSLAEFIAQRRRWLNGSFFAAVYALAHWYRIWQSNHSFMRNIVFLLQFIYTLYNILFAWFGMANFYLTYYFIARTMANPYIDPIPGNYGQLIVRILDYLYLALMVSMFICSLGNRPQGSKLLYMGAMICFSLFMAYMIGGAVFLSIRGVHRALVQMAKDKQSVTVVSVLFGNSTLRDLIIAVGSTYGVYFLASLLYLQPWHMITSFVQYILMVPTYINVLNVYAFCNTHDVSWGTKSQGSQKMDLGVAVPMPNNKGGSQTVQLVLPGIDNDLNSAYEEALAIIKTPVIHEHHRRDAKTKQEDYYRMIRTWLVLFWIMSNAILALVIVSTEINGLLDPGDDANIDPNNPVKGFYLANWYFSFILWSVAGLVMFRFIGSMIYLVRATFWRGR